MLTAERNGDHQHVDKHNRGDKRHHHQAHEPPGVATSPVLVCEEIHCASRWCMESRGRSGDLVVATPVSGKPRASRVQPWCRQNDTFGASLICSASSNSSSDASWKPKMPASSTGGNVLR